MLIKHPSDLSWSEVTPKALYVQRREFIRTTSSMLVAAAGLSELSTLRAEQTGTRLPNVTKSPLSTTGERISSYKDVTTYNNYYEFGTDKDQPARNAPRGLKTQPWTLTIDGEVTEKKVLDYDALFKIAPLEERVYRMRCVEGWSFVIPWVGVPLSALLKQVQPTGKAKYVVFESRYTSGSMLSSEAAGIYFPYFEGLRIDEAMHPLTILAVGLYDEILPAQNGAPIRLVVPWKYGFKGAKAITRIRFVEKEPRTTWMQNWPQAYGFYSNVNPEVDHPGHSQAMERRLGEIFRRRTLMFNGYGEQVASMYVGMDLRKSY